MQSARGVSTVRRSVVVPGVAVFCVASMLAGCTSNAEPSPLPSPSPSAASPSPSATPPPLPPEAQGSSAKAAKAFVRHWVEVMNFAAASGDTDLARSLTTDRCGSCRDMLAKIDRVYGAGGEFRGDGWRVLQIRYQPFQPPKRPILSVGLKVSRQVMIARPGATAETFEGGRNQLNLRLVASDSSWKVLDLERLS